MRGAVTVTSQWRTCCLQSSLSLELSGEARQEIFISSINPSGLFSHRGFSPGKITCKQTLIVTPADLTAFLFEKAQGIKETD